MDVIGIVAEYNPFHNGHKYQIDKIKEMGIPVNEENEKKVREDLRKEYGMAAYAIILLPKIEKYLEEGNVVLDGLYSWDELMVLKEKFKDNLCVLSITTDRRKRYERLESRDIRPLSKENANKRDIAEIENLKKGGPIAYADYYVLNNGSMDEFIIGLKKVTEIIME